LQRFPNLPHGTSEGIQLPFLGRILQAARTLGKPENFGKFEGTHPSDPQKQ
jgi:hypothetical protein